MNAIVNYVRSLYHSIKKEDVIKTTEAIYTTLNDNLLPMLETALSNKDIDAIKDNQYLKHIGKLSGITNGNDGYEVLAKLNKLYENIYSKQDTVTTMITEELSDVIVDTSSHPKDILILKMVDSIGAFVLYLPDLLNYVVANNDLSVPKMKLDQITKGVNDYVNLVKYFNTVFDKQLKDIVKMKNDEAYDMLSAPDGFLSNIFSKLTTFGSIPMLSSFIGNPIYHIRMWLVDKEINKYNKLKEQKEMFSNQVLELRAKGNSDEKINKAIEYYNKKIENIEYEIKKIEDKANG
jgi:hypothetical protein